MSHPPKISRAKPLLPSSPASPLAWIPLHRFGRRRTAYVPLQSDQGVKQNGRRTPYSTQRCCGFGHWTVEIIAWAISLSGIAAVVIVLRVYDEQPLPQWPLGIGLNAVISILALVSKTLLLMMTASCIGQLKWTRLTSREHRLIDLELFDAASKRPEGFFKDDSHSIIVACLVAGSRCHGGGHSNRAFHAAGRYIPPRNVSVSTATVPRTQTYQNYAPGQIQAIKDTSLTMKAAAYNGLFNPNVAQLRSSVQVQCSTGNCTFPPYSSLAICSKCANVTDMIVKKGCYTSGTSTQCTNYTLPNRLQLYGYNKLMNSSTGGELNKNILDTYGPTILNLSVLLSKSSFETPTDINAYDCSIYFCLQRYRAKVSHGVFEEIVSDEFTPDIPNPEHAVNDADISITVPSSFVGVNESTNFTLSPVSFRAIGAYLFNLLTGSIDGETGEAIYSSDVMNALYNSLAFGGNGTSIIEALTTSMTIDVRTNPAAQYLPFATGTAWQDTTFVYVRWSWLLLPLGLEVLGLCFLSTTMIISFRSKTPVWKSSLLAALFFGRPDTISGWHQRHPSDSTIQHDLYPGDYTLDQMKEKAKNIRVRLSNDEDGSLRLL